VFGYRDERGRVQVAFTDRHGGASNGRFSSLNLAEPGGEDDATGVNLAVVTEAFTGDATVVAARMRQVHGADIALVDAPVAPGDEPPRADGLVTTRPGVPLLVRVADCVPVLLADPGRGVVAAVHAGRPGLVAGVLENAVERMHQLGAEHVVGWLGPHVCGACYEVPEPMRADVSATVPAAYATTSWGTPSLDLGAGACAQLHSLGVETVDASRCTREAEDLYSYRRQGRDAGRQAGLIWVAP
jgi:YfiH family protein